MRWGEPACDGDVELSELLGKTCVGGFAVQAASSATMADPRSLALNVRPAHAKTSSRKRQLIRADHPALAGGGVS